MYNIKFVEEHIQELKETSIKKGISLEFDYFIELNEERKSLKGRVDELHWIRNEKGKKVGELKRRGEDPTELIDELEDLKEGLTQLEQELKEIQKKVNDFIAWIPNLIHPSVRDEPIVVREPTGIRDFSFKPLAHIELGESLGILDFEAASRIAGSNFVLYKGKGAVLERALVNFMLDLHIKRHQYTEIFPPFLANEESMFSTGQLPKLRDDMYITERDGFFLNPTAEVPLTNILAGSILSPGDLPIKYCGYTACFRREAGSYGKETRGLLRVHQFNKVELVNFVLPDESYPVLEDLLDEALDVIKLLELPYRVIQLPFDDLSFASAKTYDIEIYAPGVDKWLEVSSVSNFEDFQAKRAEIRVRIEGETKPVHTLNASGVATARLMVSLIENYQTEEGEIEIPEPLLPYINFEKIG
ncbi:MAG: serine--tRNA ligase [candidate division WOR-3 bacterium]|nr:serine--tRNA ligase [candidate division WOR-3 bacterium]